MLPASWRETPSRDLVRYGSKHDGGYVIGEAAARAATTLISMGLNSDWHFEADFHDHTGAKIICFDHTVDVRFWLKHTIKRVCTARLFRALDVFRYLFFFHKAKISHHQVKIGYDIPGQTTLISIAGSKKDEFFLKVDIEGAEYR